MNIAGISPGSLLLIFLIAVILFGSKRIGSLGHDVGRAINGFKRGMKEQDEPEK